MDIERALRGVFRLVRRLEPSLKRREPTLMEVRDVIVKHGLEDKTLPELARMGFAKKGAPPRPDQGGVA